jgi:hypothetical protein
VRGSGLLALGAPNPSVLGDRVLARPLRLVPWVLVLAFSAWFLSLSPSHDRDWPAAQAREARARVRGRSVTLSNVRSFRYRSETDFDPRWVDRVIGLDRVRSLDVIVSSWGWRNLIHTIVSWDIEGEEPLAISIESRRERDEPFDPIRGFLRQYELLYIVSDEADVVALRAVHRGERVQLFRTSTTPETAQRLLLAYLAEVESLAETPAFYDSFSRNCSTAARRHVADIGVADTWDWRVVLNGHIDAFLYDRGLLDDSISLEELRTRSDITAAVQAADGDPAFSARIREGVPSPNGRP